MSSLLEPILPRHLLTEKFPTTVEDTDVSSLKCPICLEICQDAVIENKCGHTFCKKCLNSLFNGQNETRCPQTRETITLDQVTPNRAVRDLILQLKVYCVLKCSWKGHYCDLEKHLMRECPYVKFKCLNPECTFVQKRKDAEKHVKTCEFRPARCNLCNGYFIAGKLKEHEAKCPAQPMLCPYGCGVMVKRQDVNRHYDVECKNKVLDCEYKEYGCDATLKRYKYDDHMKEKASYHLEILKEKADYYKKEWATLLVEVEVLREMAKTSEIHRMLKEKDEEIQSLRNDLNMMRKASQNLVRKNEELEQRIQLLRTTQDLYSHLSSEREDNIYDNSSDEEKSPEDIKKSGYKLSRKELETLKIPILRKRKARKKLP